MSIRINGDMADKCDICFEQYSACKSIIVNAVYPQALVKIKLFVYDEIGRVDFCLSCDCEVKAEITVPYDIHALNCIHCEGGCGIVSDSICAGKATQKSYSQWIDVSEDNFGLSVFSSPAAEFEIKNYAVHLKTQLYPDKNFRFSLYPHKGNYQLGRTYKMNEMFETPLFAAAGSEQGNFPLSFSVADTDTNNISITCLKKSEIDNSIILRLCETSNRLSEVKLKTNIRYNEIYIADMQENVIENINEIKIKPYEIKTVKLMKNNGGSI